MNKKLLFEAIGYISDEHIAEFADVSSKRIAHKHLNIYVRVIVPIAACFCIAIGLVVFIKNVIANNISNIDHPVQAISTISINGYTYEEVTSDYNDRLIEKGLTAIPTADMLGEYMGNAITPNESGTCKVFDCSTIRGKSIVIVETGEEYKYFFFCNAIDRTIDLDELLAIFGMDNALSIDSVTIGNVVITDKNTINSLITNCRAMSQSEYNEYIFSGLSEEECVKLSEQMANERMEITFRGICTDLLTLDYYPSLGVAWAANTGYLLTYSEI